MRCRDSRSAKSRETR